MEFIEQLKEWRHHFHKNPESAFEEVNTSKYIADELGKMGYEVHTGIGITGLVANLRVGNSNAAIGLRADIDCIQLQEQATLPYSSQTPNRMHACGHDGHMATLLGAARLLSERKNFNGTVRLIFQPAEEPGKGAIAMIEDGLFERFPVDEIYGLHNMPHLPQGTFHTRVGGIMASEDNFVIKIKGRGCHASSPHLGIDPLVVAAEIILALQTVVARNVSPIDNAVVSCTEIHSDGIRNAIPSNVVIKGDTRSFSPKIQALLEDRMRKICYGICEAHGAECQFEYTHEFSPTVNWEGPVVTAVQAAGNVVGEDKVFSECVPMMGSEDFGFFMTKVPGCFVFLGSSKSEDPEINVPLHNSIYDYNDSVLETGAEFFAEIVRLKLGLV
jgi:hippurate hydrolase